MTLEKQGEDDGFRPSPEVERVAAKVDGVLRAADAQAKKIRAQAEAEAQRLRDRKRRAEEYIAGARAEVDELAERAERITLEARDAVADALGDMSRVASELQAGIASVTEAVGKLNELAREVESEPASDEAPEASDGESLQAKEQARAPIVRAVQMAMAGSPRAEIDSTLRDEFGIEDTTPILDEALGAP